MMDLKCIINLIYLQNLVFPDNSSPEYNDPTGKSKGILTFVAAKQKEYCLWKVRHASFTLSLLTHRLSGAINRY
jgi:hypothetical protein